MKRTSILICLVGLVFSLGTEKGRAQEVLTQFQVSTDLCLVPKGPFGASVGVVEEGPPFFLLENSLVYSWGSRRTCITPSLSERNGTGVFTAQNSVCPQGPFFRRWHNALVSFLDAAELPLNSALQPSFASSCDIQKSEAARMKFSWGGRNPIVAPCFSLAESNFPFLSAGASNSIVQPLFTGSTLTYTSSAYSVDDEVVVWGEDGGPGARALLFGRRCFFQLPCFDTHEISTRNLPEVVRPCVAADRHDRFVVGWPEEDGSVRVARIVGTDVLSARSRVGRAEPGSDSVAVAVAADGSFVVTWWDGRSVLLRRYSADDRPLPLDSGPVVVTDQGSDRHSVAIRGPFVSAQFTRIAVVWESGDALKHRVFTGSLFPLYEFDEDVVNTTPGVPGAEAAVQRLGHTSMHPVVLRPDLTLVVAWQDVSDAFSPGHVYSTFLEIPQP